MSQRSLEIRVGALVLCAIAVMVALVLALGGGDYFERTYTLNVNFDNPGGLKPGAPVRISGVKVGKVYALHLRNTVGAEPGKRMPPIRVELRVSQQYRDLVREDSLFYITVQGVLGEQYLAIEPGSPDRPILADGALAEGLSPPRIDLILSESYALLNKAFKAVQSNEQKISETFDGLHETLKASGDFAKRNSGKLDRVVDNVESLSGEARDTVKAARERYVEGPQVTRMFNTAERAISSVERDVVPLAREGRELVGDLRKITKTLGSDEQLGRYQAISRDAQDAVRSAKTVAKDAEGVLGDIKRGKGSLGALARDETLYDDLQELVRDLKHNPWKLFWRE